MIFNLQDANDLPVHLEKSLRGLHKDSAKAVRIHFEYHGLDVREFHEAHFAEGFGDLSMKCNVAADIAKYMDCPVHFFHNGSPVTAYPDTATAAEHDWERRRDEKVGMER